jgi:small subunit ribosomal protein S15
MVLSVETKQGVIGKHRQHEKDTGSAEVQIALLTTRILELTEHLKANKKDHASRRGLLMLVGRRSSLLKYLTRTDRARYLKIISSLGLRK